MAKDRSRPVIANGRVRNRRIDVADRQVTNWSAPLGDDEHPPGHRVLGGCHLLEPLPDAWRGRRRSRWRARRRCPRVVRRSLAGADPSRPSRRRPRRPDRRRPAAADGRRPAVVARRAECGSPTWWQRGDRPDVAPAPSPRLRPTCQGRTGARRCSSPRRPRHRRDEASRSCLRWCEPAILSPSCSARRATASSADAAMSTPT